MLNVVHYLDDSFNEVMLFGHNPDLTSLANLLSNQQVDNIPACGIFCVDFDIQSWQDVKKGKGIFSSLIIRRSNYNKILLSSFKSTFHSSCIPNDFILQ
jgi:phosphohistidine phosphatase SixA